LAASTAMRERSVELPWTAQGEAQARAVLDELSRAARDELLAQDVVAGAIRVERKLHLRYEGTDTALPVALDTPEAMLEAFQKAYLQRFSFLMPERRLVIESAVAEAIGDEAGARGDAPRLDSLPADGQAGGDPVPADTVRMHA